MILGGIKTFKETFSMFYLWVCYWRTLANFKDYIKSAVDKEIITDRWWNDTRRNKNENLEGNIFHVLSLSVLLKNACKFQRLHKVGSKKVKQSHYSPGQAQRFLRKLRFPDFVTTAQDGVRLSALRTGRLYSQEILLVLISVRGWFDPRSIVRSEGLCQWKVHLQLGSNQWPSEL